MKNQRQLCQLDTIIVKLIVKFTFFSEHDIIFMGRGIFPLLKLSSYLITGGRKNYRKQHHHINLLDDVENP